MVVEETFIDGDAEVVEVDHLGGLNVDVVHVDLALAFSLHSESVEDALGGLLDAKDHDFVNDLGGGLGVHVLVANSLGNRDQLAVVDVLDLSALVVTVVVVLAVVEVKLS